MGYNGFINPEGLTFLIIHHLDGPTCIPHLQNIPNRKRTTLWLINPTALNIKHHLFVCCYARTQSYLTIPGYLAALWGFWNHSGYTQLILQGACLLPSPKTLYSVTHAHTIPYLTIIYVYYIIHSYTYMTFEYPYIYILLNKFVYISFHILSPSQYIHIHIYHILVDITMSGAWSSRNKFGGAHWFSFPDIIFPGYPPTILRPTRFLCLNLLGDAACHARLRRPGLLRSHWLNSVWCIADQCQAGQKKWWRTIQRLPSSGGSFVWAMRHLRACIDRYIYIYVHIMQYVYIYDYICTLCRLIIHIK
jgi:hypothetical protein